MSSGADVRVSLVKSSIEITLVNRETIRTIDDLGGSSSVAPIVSHDKKPYRQWVLFRLDLLLLLDMKTNSEAYKKDTAHL